MTRIHHWRGAWRLLALLLAIPLVPGCDGLLDVEDLDVTSSESFVDETSIPALRASVRADFVNTYETMILYTGLLGDEWVSSGTFGTRIEVDRRDIDVTNSTVEGMFSGISRVRAIADFVNDRFDIVDPEATATAERAEVRALGGLALVLMTETYCEGTPMSRYDFAAGTFEYGAPLTRDQVLDAAVDRFTAAIDVADDGSDEQYLAQVGLARALLNAGDYAGAAARVANVPTGWLFRAEHDAQDGQENPVWDFNISQERWSAAEQEGDAGLPYLSAADPRMLWRRTGGTDAGFDRNTPQYDALKYADRPAFAIIADGVEARLIEAEAALDAGNADGMLAILNELRSQVGALMAARNWDFQTRLVEAGVAATLPQLELPGTFDEQVDLLFQERAFWLWLSAHRLGDMRRLIRQYGLSSDAVFPTGVYAPHGNPKGGSYGPDVNFPIPVQEEGNPEDGAGQCMNRNA